jgi:hypothetical protein
MFTADLYIRISVNRIRATNLAAGVAAERFSDVAFSPSAKLRGE